MTAQEKAEQVLASFNLDLRAGYENRQIGCFVWRRAVALANDDTSLSVSAITAEVRKEHGQLAAFIDSKLGRDRKSGPLIPRALGGSGDTSPAHLDLEDLARQRVSEKGLGMEDRAIRNRVTSWTRDRKRRVMAIVWRAGFLASDELWKTDGTLREKVLGELLDRRLRSVERMAYNVVSVQTVLGLRPEETPPPMTWEGSEANGPWRDGIRVRTFDYANVPGYFKDWLIPASEIGQGKAWFSHDDRQLTFRNQQTIHCQYSSGTVDHVQNTRWRFPAESSAAWGPSAASDDHYGADLRDNASAAAAIDRLFDYGRMDADGEPLFSDMLKRTWMACDHVASVVCLEALLFGLRRRLNEAKAAAEFERLTKTTVTVPALWRGHDYGTIAAPYVRLDAFNGRATANPGVLMGYRPPPGSPPPSDSYPLDTHFENGLIPSEDLQVGDWGIMVNMRLYRNLSAGSWMSENVLVMDVDSDVDDSRRRSKIKRTGLRLQGHGSPCGSHRELCAFLAGRTEEALIGVVNGTILPNVEADPSRTAILLRDGTAPTAHEEHLVRWLPFPELTNVEVGKGTVLTSGPWWLVVPLRGGSGTFEERYQLMLSEYPHLVGGQMVINSSATKFVCPAIPRYPTGDDFFKTFALFPIFEPTISQRTSGDKNRKVPPWASYFQQRKSEPISGVMLRPTKVDGSMVPGLFWKKSVLPVVRPTVDQALS